MATPSGISVLGDLQPGSHVGQFYWDEHDLLETLVPYFVAGLRQHERCIWVCSPPLCAAEARSALASVVQDLEDRERAGQISIFDHSEWYLQRGHLSPDQVIEGWLAAEHEALAAGYRGLRINGNTFWLQPEQWDAFADYEARVHAAFRDREIVALCSYPLSKCESHQVVDVLHNHGASLVRSAGGDWGLVHGATAVLATLEADRYTSRAKGTHSVELYRGQFPLGRVADRLQDALRRGAGAAALVTREHGNALRSELQRRDVELLAAIGRGQLAILDADAVFQAAWARPGLHADVLAETIRTPIAAMIERFGTCVAFGELVDLLARAGDRAAAMTLERWWNDQLAQYPIDLACAYSLETFPDAESVVWFKDTCHAHGAAGVDGPVSDREVDRLRAELAQLTNALAQEVSKRQVIDAAYASARDAREHLVLLNRLTGALGEVTTRAQLVEVVRDLVTPAVHASTVVVVEADASEPLLAHGPAALVLCDVGGADLASSLVG